MTIKDQLTSPPEVYQHLLEVISSQRFLNKEGLGNEVPFFICPFHPKNTSEILKIKVQLTKNLKKIGVDVLEVNLYDLVVELLKHRGIWDQVLELEQTVDKEQLKELLQGALDTETYLIPAIEKQLLNNSFDVLFLSGVGEVFPYIRSHNVLNNLQSKAKDKPTVMFFPGQYTHSLESGASLKLFNQLEDDKYYRAFNIFHYEV